MTDYYGAFSTSTSNFPGQIQSATIDTSYKSIVTCLYNNKKIEKNIWLKCSPVSAPPQPPSWGWVMGSRVSAESHPHRSTRTRELQCSFITISLYIFFFWLVGAFLWLSRGVASLWCQVCFRSSVVVNLHFSCPNSASVLSSCYSWY